MESAAEAKPAPEAGLLGGLLTRFTEIVGEGPGYATFHFASQQEGARLAADCRPADLPELLVRIDAILGHHSRLLECNAQHVRLQVDSAPLLRGAGRTGAGVVLGFWEGVLRSVYKRPFDGGIEEGRSDGVAVLDFKGRAAA